MERIAVYAIGLHMKDVLKDSVLFLHNIGVAAARTKLVFAAPEGSHSVADRISS